VTAQLLLVQVVPRASRDRIGPRVGDRLKVQLTAPPVDGEANTALIRLLAKAIGVRKADVTIVAGETSRQKTVRVDGASPEALQALGEVP
jgi:uncharacterized protein (TIGR00251 family)